MKRLLPLVWLWVFGASAWAQGPATGFPPYSSIEPGVADATNRYDLNTNIQIPIVSSQGRGLNLQFPVVYNSALWRISSSAWVSVTDQSGHPTWGWNKVNVAGMVTSTTTTSQCEIFPQKIIYYYNIYSNAWYFDADGTGHNFPTISYYYDPCTNQNVGTSSGYASDGSGYYVYSGSAGPSTVISPSGIHIEPVFEIYDTNGNFISPTVVNGSETDWKDSAGHNTLKIISGASSIQYEVLDPTGNYQTTTLNLTTYNIKTNFACSGVTEYTGTASLPSSITLPNGLSYSFAYEGTPSHSGYYTGRVSEITLPNGGYIQYQYTGSNDGINCSDGSILGLTRTQNDGTTSSTWTFSRAQNGSNWVTTVTAPQMPYDTAANQSVYTFNSSGQETSRQIYQGPTSGTLLRTVNTTWASNGSPATKTTILDNNQQSEVETTFDSNGNLLTLKEHDYGSGAPGAVLRTTNYTLLTTSAYTNLNIINRVTEKTVADSTGTIQYREDTAYDGTTISPCPTGAAQHNDRGYPCTFTTRGNPTSITTYTNAAAPSGGVTKNSYYDIFGNLVQADLNCCESKSWSYSSTTQYSYPDSETCGPTGGPQLTTSHTYNAYTGQAASETDPNNQPTSYSYDFMRRLTTVTRPDNSQITYSYADAQHQVTETDPIQGTVVRKRTSSLDGFGRIMKATVTDASGNTYAVVQKVLDSLGRNYQISNPFLSSAQYWTTSQYDAVGRLTKRILQDNHQAAYAYSGPYMTVTDPAGDQSKFQMNGLGQLANVFEPDVTNNNSLTIQTSYAYTILGDLGTVTQGSQTRSYNYDGMGRLTSKTTPEASTTTLQYNNFDFLTQRTDGRGVITTYTPDTLNRTTQVSYNVGATGVAPTPTVTYTYGTNASQNNNGRLTTMTDGTGSESYTYDILGRTTQTQKVLSGTTYTIGHQYNQAGQVTSVTYPSGRAVQRTYDAIGRLSAISDSNNHYVSSLAYNTNFQMTGFSFGNGVSASQGFSSDRAQRTSLSHTGPGGNIVNLNYSYNQSGGNNGEIASITDNVESGRTIAYTYDTLGRISTALTNGSSNYPQWGLSFTYDRYGNRIAQNVTAGTAPMNQVTVNAATNHINTPGYSYDAGGNMTNDALNTLTYDAENRVLTSAGSGSGSYSYDGNGLRALKTSAGATTAYILDGGKAIAEYASGASPSSPSVEYVHMGNHKISQIQGGVTSYYHTDHLSTRALTDSSGNILGQQGHYPFGESAYTTGTGTNWKFTSYERDTESGNDNAKFRYSANRLGRFLTTDPARSYRTTDPQTFNLYSYVTNMPIHRVDPSGMLPEYCQVSSSLWSGFGSDEFGDDLITPLFFEGEPILGADFPLCELIIPPLPPEPTSGETTCKCRRVNARATGKPGVCYYTCNCDTPKDVCSGSAAFGISWQQIKNEYYKLYHSEPTNCPFQTRVTAEWEQVNVLILTTCTYLLKEIQWVSRENLL